MAYSDPRAVAENKKAYYTNNKERLLEEDRTRRAKIRTEVIAHYGGRCQCCGEDNDIFLCIDHIGGGGKSLRPTQGKAHFYRWLKNSGFPEGFRVLCWNCNYGYAAKGICPHQLEK